VPFTMRGNAKAMRRYREFCGRRRGKSKRRSNSARVVMGLPEVLDETRGYGVPMPATCTECRGRTEHGEIKTLARTRPNR
jgi:hypothetical protein